MNTNDVPSNLTKLHEFMAVAASFVEADETFESRDTFTELVMGEFKKLGAGAFRFAFSATDDNGKPVCVKIVRNGHRRSGRDDFANTKSWGMFARKDILNANRHEFDAWKEVESKGISSLMLPPLAYWELNGHSIIIFPVVKTADEINDWDDKAYGNDFFSEVYLAIRMLWGDTHGGNIGVYKGFPVLIDNGHEGIGHVDDTVLAIGERLRLEMEAVNA